jgi:Co/Zn/Cd efflux system component
MPATIYLTFSALVVAWAAAIQSKRAPSPRFTYGLRGSSILAALFNAVFLLVAVGAIGWDVNRRGVPTLIGELSY